MNRRIIVWQKITHAGIAAAIIFLSLLPTLGWTWHRVLPEHDHWLIGARHTDAPLAPDDCIGCTTSGETTLHLPSSIAIQIAAIAIGIASAISLSVPDGFAARVDAPLFRSTSPNLPRLDPPPKMH